MALQAAGEEAPAEPHATPTRMYKMLLSADGSNNPNSQATAMEYESTRMLDGLKVGSTLHLQDVYVLRGMLLITPKSLKSVQ